MMSKFHEPKRGQKGSALMLNAEHMYQNISCVIAESEALDTLLGCFKGKF